jgi:mannosyltransferase OCH1-like enzyme
MKKILNSDAYINKRINNIFIYPKNMINKVKYKALYIDKNKFELQVLKMFKQTITKIDFIYYQVIFKTELEPTNSDLLEKSIDCVEPDIIIFFNNINFKKKYKLQWECLENKIDIKIIPHDTNDKITDNIKLICVKNKQHTIEINNFTNTVYTNEYLVDFILNTYDTLSINNNNQIPNVIMQTYKSNDVNKAMYDASRTWLICNPTYRYEYYTDGDCILFIQKYFPKDVLHAFLSLIPGAFKADLFRYCYLYIKGGVYTDMDNICMIDLNNIIKNTDIFVTVKDRPLASIYNAFIASSPNNPIFTHIIKNILHNVKHQIYIFNNSNTTQMNRLSITGPKCFGNSLNTYLKRSIDTPFYEGEHDINNFKFKLFSFTYDGNYIIYGNTIISLVKYAGFERVLDYERLYRTRTVYANLTLESTA